jgi:putative PIN family toxin of toxin-antitoxin system
MIDTNVLISASLFPKSRLGQAIKPLSDKHAVVLCTTIIDELHDVYNRKFPDRLLALESFLKEFSFETVYTPKISENMPQVRDKKDTPILASAILEDVDVLITGDGDFSGIEIDRPEVLSPVEFFMKY